MKTKLLIFLSILSFNHSFSQSTISDVFFNGMPILSAKMMDHLPEISKADSKDASNQILQHIIKKIKYPKVMEDYQVECLVNVLIEIREDGRVNEVKIFDSPSYVFDRAIHKAISGLKKVKTKYSIYYGVKNLIVPIQFSMDH